MRPPIPTEPGPAVAGGPRPRARLSRALRRRGVIFAEVGAVALAAALSTVVAQNPAPLDRARLAIEHPLAARAVEALGLDHVFTTAWFLALVAACAASLVAVTLDQWRRLAREWSWRPTEAAFGAAPFRAELDRPRSGDAPRTVIHSAGRLGLAGSPVLHLGLVVLVAAGLARLAFSAEAVVDLYEGEVLPPASEGFGAQWPGLLAAPVSFREPLEVLEIRPDRYASGGLRQLDAALGVGAGAARRTEGLAVNAPLALDGGRLYLTSQLGCAAMLEIVRPSGTERTAVLLGDLAGGEYGGSHAVGRLRLRLRTRCDGGGLELRAQDDGALAGYARVAPGGEVALPSGERIVLHDLRWWARFVAARDLSTWAAFAGFALVVLGGVLVFGVVKVDSMIAITPAGDRERVVVAMRVQRLAPLYAGRFERLVRGCGARPIGDEIAVRDGEGAR